MSSSAVPVRIAAVVVCYRTPADSVGCVASLATQGDDVGVVLVHNGCADACDDARGDVDAAAGAIGRDAIVLRLEDNRGFGAGCNAGIGRALEHFPELEHVLLLNPDARCEDGSVAALRACAARHPAAGIVGGRVVSYDGERVLYENGSFRPWTLSAAHVPAPRGHREFACDFVTGALMLLAADLLRDGLRFDEQYFLYVEDLDICREVRRRGRELWVTLDAVVRHREGASQADEEPRLAGLRPRQLRWITRNKVRFARKWLPAHQRLAFYAVAFVLKPLAGVVRFGQLRFLQPYFAALREGLRMPVTQRR